MREAYTPIETGIFSRGIPPRNPNRLHGRIPLPPTSRFCIPNAPYLIFFEMLAVVTRLA
jgi:hypothetical protein